MLKRHSALNGLNSLSQRKISTFFPFRLDFMTDFGAMSKLKKLSMRFVSYDSFVVLC